MSHSIQNKKNRFPKEDFTTHTGGLNGAFGFTPSPGAGGVTIDISPSEYGRDMKNHIIHRKFISVDKEPPFDQPCETFDHKRSMLCENSRYVGKCEFIDFDTNESIQGVEFWSPL